MATPMEVDGAAAAPMDIDADNTESEEAFKALMQSAKKLEASDPDKAIAAYKDIINNKTDIPDDMARGRENAIYALGEFFVAKRRAQAISDLGKELRPLMGELPKAKTAKIVRTLIGMVSKVPGSEALQIEMCRDCIAWCKSEKRTFLRQRVETKLAALLLDEKQYQEALELLAKLLSEVKKLDDKLLLVEIFMIECRTHYTVQDLPKSKASLTAAKTNANAIHCPPLLQAEIDLWSGIVGAREKDYRTAYSYFYEAFECYHQADKEQEAKMSLKLMLLSKIMGNRPQDVKPITNSKSGLKYPGAEIDAMLAVAGTMENRCLKKFEAVLHQYKAQLGDDVIVSWHLSDLNETLLEQNILRILEPFSKVEIVHVAELIELPVPRTLSKLREMILDKKLNGTLDQGVGVLIVYDEETVRSTYDNALKTIKNTSKVLDTLYGVAKQLA
jgi:26S proteasome regulatory subunit N6